MQWLGFQRSWFRLVLRGLWSVKFRSSKLSCLFTSCNKCLKYWITCLLIRNLQPSLILSISEMLWSSHLARTILRLSRSLIQPISSASNETDLDIGLCLETMSVICLTRDVLKFWSSCHPVFLVAVKYKRDISKPVSTNRCLKKIYILLKRSNHKDPVHQGPFDN